MRLKDLLREMLKKREIALKSRLERRLNQIKTQPAKRQKRESAKDFESSEDETNFQRKKAKTVKNKSTSEIRQKSRKSTRKTSDDEEFKM